MTEKQKEVLQQAENLLIEHFDSYVLITVALDVEDNLDGYNFGHNGGMATAIGLCETYALDLKDRLRRKPD